MASDMGVVGGTVACSGGYGEVIAVKGGGTIVIRLTYQLAGYREGQIVTRRAGEWVRDTVPARLVKRIDAARAHASSR